ncbi:MAG: hypothetical protein H7Y01_14280 [Ferruginibacter sp.]|nr:hypothetical protein [Chitinophagaceae bacterium]
MQKNYSIVSLVRAFIIIASVLLFPVTVTSQELTLAEKTALCQKERQNLDNLNEKLTIISFQISRFKEYVSELTPYQQEALKLSDKKLDIQINLRLSALKSIAESINYAVDTLDAFRHVHKLQNVQITLDYLTEIKTKRLFGEIPDPNSNVLQKAIQQYKKEIDQLEEAEKYLRNDIAMNKGRISRLMCDDKTTAVSKNDIATKSEEYMKKLVGGWTGKPTPWGTAGGPCQIKYENGKLTLINENNDISGASIKLGPDGTATINANKWPVQGEVNKTVNSIKWSNKSEWVR